MVVTPYGVCLFVIKVFWVDCAGDSLNNIGGPVLRSPGSGRGRIGWWGPGRQAGTPGPPVNGLSDDDKALVWALDRVSGY